MLDCAVIQEQGDVMSGNEEQQADEQERPAPSFRERHGHRAFVFGEGRISGYASAFLGVGALLGVLGYLFPEWLTTADLRAQLYSFDFFRNVLWLSIVLAFALGTISFVLSPQKKLALTGLSGAFGAVLLGAFSVTPKAVGEQTLSFGLDWFLLALLFSMLIFIPLERLFARHPLKVLRPQWRTDLVYFFVSHLLIQFFLLFTNSVHEFVLGFAQFDSVTALARSLPIWLQFFACVFIADLCQALTHKWYHRIPWLWKFHAVHHSSKNLDWLAGSRTHLAEALLTRTAVIVPLYLINFSETALNAYVVVVGVQAVFVHANVNWNFGPLKYVFVTPQYHHWHHSDDRAYADTNFAVHLPLVDMLMGTLRLPEKDDPQQWPATYGVFSAPVPDGFGAQLVYPFQRKAAPTDE